MKDPFAFLVQREREGSPGNYDTLEIFNIRDPRNPTRVGKISLEGRYAVWQFSVEGERVYIAAGNGGLKVFSISNPQNPVYLGGWQRGEDFYVLSVFVKDTVAYIGVDSNDTLFILNVKEPQNIREIGRIRVGQIDDPGYVRNYVLVDTILYCAVLENDSGCVALNVRNPREPSIIARTGERAFRVVLLGNLLVLQNEKGICLYDARDPRSLNFLSIFELIGLVPQIKVLNDSLILLNTVNGYFILDISQRPQVRLRGRYPPVDSVTKYAVASPAVRDTLLYAGFLGRRRLCIFNFANPDSIILVGSCSLSVQYPWEFGFRTCALKETLAFVAGQWSLYCVNVKDPRNPREVSRLLMPSTDFDINKIVIRDSLIYAACGQAGFWIFDVSNPQRPYFRDDFPSRYYTRDVFVKETLAFVADNYGGFRIFNIKNPDWIREVTTLSITPYQCLGVWVEGNLAFVAFGRMGLRIYDISNPGYPREVGYYYRGGSTAIWLEVNNGLIHLANYELGYRCFEYYGTGLEDKGEGRVIKVFPTKGR